MMATNPRSKKARPRVAGLDREGKPIAATTAAETATESPKLTKDPAATAEATTTATKPAGQDARFADTQTAITRPLGTAMGAAAAATARPAGSSPWKLAIGLGIAAAVFAVVAIIGAVHPGASIGADKAFIDEPATTELTSQAGAKACDVLAYDGTDFDKWAAKARSALTGKPLKEFNEYLPTQKQLIEQTKAVADCKVDGVGVMEMTGGGDGAKAHVIMNLVISQSLAGQAANSGAPAVDLHMVRKGDAWLIEQLDEIRAVS